MRAVRFVVFLAFAVVALPRVGFAFDDFEGTRAQGMGGATRAWALGDSAILLNPSGMTLAKVYNVEASYGYTSRMSGQFLHASIVDSTSASNLAAGAYYTYRSDESSFGVPGHGHEAGLSLALPFGRYLSFGVTGKWLRLVDSDAVPDSTGGITFDAGATVRATDRFSLGVVGQNLRDLQTGQVPQLMSYGLAFLPLPTVTVAIDGVTTFTHDDVTHARGTGFRAGGEWSIMQRVAVRTGGGYDPNLGVGYVAGGLSALSEIGAVDLGVRGDVWTPYDWSRKNLWIGLSLRLFVGSAASGDEPDATPPSSSSSALPPL
ncbi:MAG TPA: hypothetical protein VHJ20_23400 [Polyangia bacterium]|nr:hypothetical protein [Polyangia bacterium]